MPADPPNFITELKRRKVFRVAVGYVVIAWIALQFFDLVLDNINAPDWVMQAIMATMAIGFPLAIVLAWAFEISPDGVRAAPGRNRTFALLVAAISVVALGYTGWIFLGTEQAEPGSTAASTAFESGVIDSIAVLPFESFSADSQDEYFADGLADTLLHKLAQLSNLKVIARNSSFQFKGSNKDAREIGNILGVAALLEGSVQRQGDEVRVIAQLIDTSNGVHIWSATFNDAFQNIFELQDRIAQEIMQQLQISISERDRVLALRNGTDSPEAYELLMRATQADRDRDRESFNPETNPRLALVDRALDIDPDYVQAWETRSGIYSSALFFSTDPENASKALAEALDSAEKAVEVSPQYAGGYARLGWANFRARDIIKAEENFVRALELNPRELDAMQGLGLLKVGDDPQFALDLFTTVRELDPQESFVYRQLYFALDALGRLDEGIETLRDGIERFPDESILKADLARVYIGDKGQFDEAALLISRILEFDGQDRIGLATMMTIWHAVGDTDRARSWLDVFAARFPDSIAIPTTQASISLLHGDVADARVALESTEETPSFRFDRSSVIAGACLIVADPACLEEQASTIGAWLDEYDAIGRAYGPAERYRMAAAILSNAAFPAAERNRAELQKLLDDSEDWPVTGGRGFRFSGYLRVMLQSLLGNDREAALELQDTLALGSAGFLYRDIFNLPPDLNPLIVRLNTTPEFEQWLTDFSGRREQARGALVQLERNGSILTASDVAL
jgi:TolB-like protein/Tfp pilus assembly protein PilF